jgi:hypothetical protein
VTGDQLIAWLQSMTAAERALHVVYMDHDQCGDEFIFPAGRPQVKNVTEPHDRAEYGERVLVV